MSSNTAARPAEGAVIFTADESFFQLPAILSLCEIVVSVETSVMHLASSLDVPTVALMRQKNPEWSPWNKARSVLITCRTRKDRIEDILSEEVVDAADVFYRKSRGEKQKRETVSTG